jgi:hypothetical protein
MRSGRLLIAGTIAFLLYGFFANPETQDAIGAAATQLVRPIMIPIVNLIGAPAFVYFASTLIVLAGLAVSLAYRVKVISPEIAALRSLREALSTLPLPSKPNTPDPREAMRRLGDLLRQHKPVPLCLGEPPTGSRAAERHPTGAILLFRRERSHGGQSGAPGTHASASGLFHLGRPDPHVRRLVVALYFAARGFRSGNMDEARGAILQLLNASAFKFLSSVAALVSALVVSLTHRFGISAARHETEKTIVAIEAFISAWRDVQTTTVSDPLAGVLERMDDLIDRFAGLNSRLDAWLARLMQGKPEAVRGAAE